MVGNRQRPWLALLVLCLGTFAILLDSTIVNVALPSLITDLHARLDEAVWVVNGYLLVFCALLIVASRLGDVFGPRRMFVAGLTVFAVASALCGAAQSPGQLIVARLVQGIGAAALAPQAMVIIQEMFRGDPEGHPPGQAPPRERMGAAFGVFSSMVGLAAVSGPTLGGLLTTYLSWRWVFYVNLPIAAAGIALVFRFVPEVRARRRRRLDGPGVLLASAGLSALAYGLIEGQRYGWGTIRAGITIPEVLAAGLVILAGFVFWERRQQDALVPLGLFRDRAFAVMAVLNAVVQFALQSMLLVNSINLQSVLGFTAVHAGLTGLPLTVALTALAPFAGRLTDRLGGKYVLMAGLVIYAAGITGVALAASTHATSLTFAPALLVAGVGMGAIFAPLATMGMRAAPARLAGAASGVLNTGRQLGATLGAAVTGAVLASQLTSAIRARAGQALATLPPAARPGAAAGIGHAAGSGVQAGRGQLTALVPPGTPAALVPEIRRVIEAVFGHGYVAAMRPTLAVPVALLLAGAAGCLLLRRGPVPSRAEIPGAGPAPGAGGAGPVPGVAGPVRVADTAGPGRVADTAGTSPVSETAGPGPAPGTAGRGPAPGKDQPL
jgi:EmrB/QacA subfamily drug resistance transporter